jgi:hypothetical protein
MVASRSPPSDLAADSDVLVALATLLVPQGSLVFGVDPGDAQAGKVRGHRPASTRCPASASDTG